MADRNVGLNGFEAQSIDEKVGEAEAVDGSKSTALSPTALPPPNIKIEMVQPKIEMVDFEGEPYVDSYNLDNDLDSKAELDLLVGPECHENKYDLKSCLNSTNEIVKFQCFHCCHETRWKHNLKKHVEILHLNQKTERATCTACGKSLKNRESLLSHIRYCDQWNSYVEKYECRICYFKTKWKAQLKKHIRRVHSTERASCPGCGKSCKNNDALNDHMRLCEQLNCDIVKFKCVDCLYETKWKSALVIHIKNMHSDESAERINCPGCRKSLKNQSSLRSHMKCCRVLNTDIADHRCPICLYEFKRKIELNAHIRSVHSLVSERPRCHGCGKSFKNKFIWSRHLKHCDKLNKEIVKLQCPICSYQTKWKGVLKTHLRRKHSVEMPSSAPCTECGRSFEHDGALKCHLKACRRSKKGIVKFKCFHCSHETKWKAALRRHIETRHLDEQTERFSCPGCGISLKTKYGFTRHIKHCDKLNDDVVKHECPICFFKTKWKTQLKAHIKNVHSVGEEERRDCPGCGKSLKNQNCLKVHRRFCEKLNKEIVKHECSICSYQTKYKHQLKSHIQRFHSVVEDQKRTFVWEGKTFYIGGVP